MKNMNEPLFGKNVVILKSILTSLNSLLGQKETDYRIGKLERAYNEMTCQKKILDSYYSIAHEIRTIEMFSEMGDITISLDSNNQPGIDLEYKNILIECVVSTTGKDQNYDMLKKSGYQEYNKIIDYNAKFHQISLRVLSVLASKRDKYYEDVNKNVISKEKPYCIFINLGSLAQEWFPGKLCNEATRFLVGRGHPMITIDKTTGKQVGGITYGHIPYIKNNNSADVICNFFGDVKNCVISAVIVTTAELNDRYSKDNVVIFTNPLANNKIMLKDFKNIPYWKVNDNQEYVPRISGRRLKVEW